mgnify:CR=1 FL=1
MATRTKTARVKAAAIEAPQTRDECDEWIGALGRAQRERVRIETALNDAIAEIKARYEADAAPYAEEIAKRTAGIQAYAETHREALCGPRSKTARLGLGELSWRHRPPKVTIRGKDAVIAACKRLGLVQFLRVSEDINREAMRAAPDTAQSIQGVSIGSAGEDLVIKPFETELEEVV